MHWWPRQTPSTGRRPAKCSMTAFDTPASSGRPGPGEISTASGSSSTICSRVSASHRCTRGSAPSSPRYWTRLWTRLAWLSMTRTRGATAAEATGRRRRPGGPRPPGLGPPSVGLGQEAPDVAGRDLPGQPPQAPAGVGPVAAHAEVDQLGDVGVVAVALAALDGDVEGVGVVARGEGAGPQAQVVLARRPDLLEPRQGAEVAGPDGHRAGLQRELEAPPVELRAGAQHRLAGAGPQPHRLGELEVGEPEAPLDHPAVQVAEGVLALV